ncbi:hypothetical protein SDC9_209266 [bioreactor metagenome]|uniref:Transposase n=1 Tax=bioreactor metagenome TaxID=1076179 RepID=A0A645JCV6_9ZZZZ
MSGTKGMKQYPVEFRAKIKEEYEHGSSVKGLSREYGISRWAIQTWCGLAKGKEVFKEPKRRGRPRKNPMEKHQELELRVKELEREVALYKAFLHAAGRM